MGTPCIASFLKPMTCIECSVITGTLGEIPLLVLCWSSAGLLAPLDFIICPVYLYFSSIAIEVTIFHLWTWRRKSMFHMNFVWTVNLKNQAKLIKSATSILSSFCLLSWELYKHLKCIYLFHFLFKLKAVNMNEYFVLTFIGTNCIAIQANMGDE